LRTHRYISPVPGLDVALYVTSDAGGDHMTEATARGSTSTPLIDQTIGANLEATPALMTIGNIVHWKSAGASTAAVAIG